MVAFQAVDPGSIPGRRIRFTHMGTTFFQAMIKIKTRKIENMDLEIEVSGVYSHLLYYTQLQK